MGKPIPGVLWIAIVSLALMIVFKVVFAFVTKPVILVDATLSAILLVGLVRGHKWAYVLTLAGVVIGTVTGLNKGIETGVGILVVDCLVLIPVLICTDFFFPRAR